MTITSRVRKQFYQQPHEEATDDQTQLIRIPQTRRQARFASEMHAHHHASAMHSLQPMASQALTSPSGPISSSHNQMWTSEEHERFLEALEVFPRGPWKYIAAYVGNKTARQAMSHAQKYRQKIARRKRGLQVNQRPRTDSSESCTYEQQPAAPVQCHQPPAKQQQLPEFNLQKRLPRWTSLHVETSARDHEVELDCPASPTEVSLPATMNSNDLDKTPLVKTHQQFQTPQQQYYQYQLSLAQFARQDHLHQRSSSHPHALASHFAGSYSDLLSRTDDHEVIVSSVSEFLDSLEEVEQLDHVGTNHDAILVPQCALTQEFRV